MEFKVIGIGEVLWDLLPSGPQLGGAPANFACHSHDLGARAAVVSRVGQDGFGQELFARFKEMGLPGEALQVDDQAPTGTVLVTLAEQGVPQFTIQENVAWDRLAVTASALETVREADAICFGSLAQRHPISRASIQRLVAATPPGALRIFDINLRQSFYSREVIDQSLRLANVLKLNDNELPILASMLELGKTPEQQIQRLAQSFGLRLVALTRGARGSLLYSEGRWSEQPSQPVQVVDTVGAGDAFTAALVLGLLNGMEMDELHAIAGEVARFVCSQAGATPALPERFRSKFKYKQERTEDGSSFG